MWMWLTEGYESKHRGKGINWGNNHWKKCNYKEMGKGDEFNYKMLMHFWNTCNYSIYFLHNVLLRNGQNKVFIWNDCIFHI